MWATVSLGFISTRPVASSRITLLSALLHTEVGDYRPIIKELTPDVALDTITMRGLLIFKRSRSISPSFRKDLRVDVNRIYYRLKSVECGATFPSPV